MNLKRIIEELKEMHGSMYPYIRVLTLTGAERLNRRLYPDLFYAVKTAIYNKDLEPNSRLLMTNVQPTLSKALIDRMAKRSLNEVARYR